MDIEEAGAQESGAPAAPARRTSISDPIVGRFPLSAADAALLPPDADVVSTVAHELLQPLTVIRGLLQLGLRYVGTDPIRERASLDLSIGHLDRMAQMIRDLLDLAAPASGKLAMVFAPFDLPTVITHSIASRDPEAAGRIEFSWPHGLMQVMGDAGRTAQVIDNLLSNALKYSDPEDRVEVTLTVVESEAEVRVADHGVGILPEERAQLFTPFYRASSARGVAGTGLGLHISRRLAERQGGGLWLEASSAAGSVFIFQIPLSRSAA